MTIKWSLRMACAERNIWRPIDLQKLLEQKTGLKLTHRAVAQLMNCTPREIKFSTLDALCNALECTPEDILFYTPEIVASNLNEVAVGDTERKTRNTKTIPKPPV